MPWLVSTKRPCHCDGSEHIGSESRLAVATLEEAQQLHDELLAEHGRRGGFLTERFPSVKVGPLPDGTTIQVEALSPLMLASRCGAPGVLVMACLKDDDFKPLADFYNAKQAA